MFTTSSPKDPQKRRVHFFEQVRVCPTLSYFDYTKREVRSCWYTAAEREQIRQEANESIRMLARQEKQRREQELNNLNNHNKSSKQSLKKNKSKKNDNNGISIICTRGLEHLTKPANRWRRHIRRAAASAVFAEIDRQIEQQQEQVQLDSERIATIYSELTKGSQLEGYVTGLADYKAAYPERQYDDDVAMSDNKKKELLHNLFFKTKNEEHKRLLRPLLSTASRRHNACRISVTI